MEDRKLIEKLKSRDNETFRLVVEKYQKLVLNCTYKFLRDRESAEDLTQEVFIEVFESIHSFRKDSQLSTWIYRIAVTKSLNHIKSLKRKKRFAMVVSLFGEGKVEEHMAAPQNMSPDQELENQERANILTWALDKLPEKQRVAFTLSKYKEMSYKEISLMMNISVPSVESLIHRAKENLKKRLYAYYQTQLL
jgi:RNA polymerase sigma factor (sigma-70 family)